MMLSVASASGWSTSLLLMAWHPRVPLLGSMNAPPLTESFNCLCCHLFPSTLSSAHPSGLPVTPCSLLIELRLLFLEQGERSLTSMPPPSIPRLGLLMTRASLLPPYRLQYHESLVRVPVPDPRSPPRTHFPGQLISGEPPTMTSELLKLSFVLRPPLSRRTSSRLPVNPI